MAGHRPLSTASQINVCVIKPAKLVLGVSYATSELAGARDPSSGKPFVGNPSDFVDEPLVVRLGGFLHGQQPHTVRARAGAAALRERGFSAYCSAQVPVVSRR
jgi:hypothetical protein